LKKLLIVLLVVSITGISIFLFQKSSAAKHKVQFTEIAVERGNLTEKALAVGKIDPDHEIVVKSQVSGIVSQIRCEVGEQVKRGEALMVVKPEPTPLELADARRQVELAVLNTKYTQSDLERSEALFQNNYISGKEYETVLKTRQEAEVRENQAKERLELLEKGSSRIGNTVVESVIRATTDGTILERLVNVGDPVVPLTSYQPGTELMRIASMEDLIFIGTVDEIDVGKISPGMKAFIHIGAQPADTLSGELYFISPKSRIKDNVVVFDIKIHITDTKSIQLRAGYSASADLIITEKTHVLYIPERLVTFQSDTAYVNIKDAIADTLVKRQVTLGFSDGLSVEITNGLIEGEKVAEK
jgi:HlyD family secretion protein